MTSTAQHPKQQPTQAPSALHRLGRFTVRRARLILTTALLFFIGAAAVGSGTLDALVLSRFEAPGSESIVTGDELDERFGVGSANFLLLVTAENGDVDSPEAAEAGAELAAALQAHPRTATVDSYWDAQAPSLRGDDGSQALILAYIPGDVTDIRQNVLPELEDDFTGESGAVAVAVGGSDELFREAAETARSDFLVAEAIVLPGLLILLVVLYRRPVAALLTLGVGLFSLAASLALMRAIAAATEVSTFAANIVLVMSVGLAVDYCLFIVNRYREETETGLERAEAVARAVATAGRTVVFSAVTVAVSLSVLLAMPFPFLRSFAYAGILVPFTAVIGAVLVLPAALALWGHRVESRGSARPVERSRWYRLADAVMRRPILWGATALALVLLLASPFLGVRFGVPDERALPEDADSRQVADQVTANFAAEASDALQILVTDPGPDLAAYAAEVSAVPGIVQVDSAAGRFVDGEQVADGDAARFAAADDRTWIEAVPSGDAMRADPYGMVERVRAVEAPFAVSVSGYPADLADFRDALLDRLPLVVALIVLVTFAILFLMTGSVVAPLKATVLNALSLSVMFGALVWIFQDGNLSGLLGFTPQGSFEPSIPILMFCIAYGLSMDYEVFMLSRIKEERDRSGDEVRSIAVGLGRSAPLVTAAALVLAFTFAVYATGDVVFLQMLGIGMALAVVVDATVIRGVLLPALMRLTGRWNWWAPAPLRRLHARIGISD